MKIKIMGFVMLLIALLPAITRAEGININNYSVILIENLAIGQSYSVKDLTNLPFEVAYEGDKPAEVILQVIKPGKNDLKPGFESVPDANWMSLGNTLLAVAANGKCLTDVKITIPKDKKYLGKKYQVMVNARLNSKNTSILSIGLAVNAKILFTIAETENPKRSNNSKTNLYVAFTPPMSEMKNVPLGKKVKIVGDKNDPIKLKNLGTDKIQYTLISIDPKKTLQMLPSGYEACPDPGFLTANTYEKTIGPKEEQPLEMWVTIPDKPEFKGKKYQFTVAVATGENSNSSVYLRVLVETSKK